MRQTEFLLSAKTAFILIALFSAGTALGIAAYAISIRKPLSTTMVISQPAGRTSVSATAVKNEITAVKTYSSERHGFDFEYPANWFIYEDDPDDIFIQPKQESENKLPIPHDGALEIKITKIDPRSVLKEAIKTEREDGFSSEEEDAEIAGGPAIKVTTKICKADSCKVIEWFFARGNRLYHISTIYPDLSYSPNFDKVISSFKFTEDWSNQNAQALTGAEFDKLFSGDKISDSKISSNAKIPNDLEKFLVQSAEKDYSVSSCKEAIDYEYKAESVDLNGDGAREFIITPTDICGDYIRGASGNGPIGVYQKKSGIWKYVGSLGGNMYSIQNKKTNGYYNIMTYWHMSCCSGIVDYYEWDKASLSYKKVSSKDLNIDTPDSSN